MPMSGSAKFRFASAIVLGFLFIGAHDGLAINPVRSFLQQNLYR